ncbi:MAG: bifunctional phosphopantothenoylcysteine decarboxylase/phosphopantothenate--cysteine ligase CoaBC [Lentisphaerae bacterium]|jgi:phosphopantothenoylcysteine decarboxylase/phosphopantothenate--cysteine ligase|nr:bifunctional phosphopantothenoylcysteine decarboxylase/phosphopantothenate--cysteine ligase CoaBC [Lentisphaerota bacterium]
MVRGIGLKVLLVADGAGVLCHTASLVTSLVRTGLTVRLSLTASAQVLVGPYFGSMLSGHPVLPFEELDENGLSGYDAILVAPASEKAIKEMCESPAWNGVRCPVLVGPGLLPKDDNADAWDELDATISAKGWKLIPAGIETCTMGALGELRVASAERCFEEMMVAIGKNDLKGKRILITTGPTAEDADPVRFVTNRSTGRMGVALARMAAWRGAFVTLIHGPMSWPIPPINAIRPVPVRSANDMYMATMELVQEQHIAILCAAVADYTPVEYSDIKIKKGQDATFALLLKRTPDILDAVGHMPGERPFLVGFAAESDHVHANAQSKLQAKNCDMLCANDVTKPGSGFAVGTNQVTVFLRGGEVRELPQMSKEDVAGKILDIVSERMSLQ